ncbi:hypothetical protein Pcinc_034019 [Petrolisthes cinctipes]|uniref:Protein fuzzy homolog n=1 Tax=Petrolisthes cinctipes TaxID=88211 RepID=A0AAE1JWC8_PETCI|nr:hypothetical protein Pcinc_038226 [Petrolisthes cinctipes]KAK3859896.1 hypothetical protein Pcinc_034019 [Petrolisthes cinctipes]
MASSWCCSLIVLSSGSGVPLLVRHVGPGKAPAYALIGSLNGVHVFGESHGVNLCNTRTHNANITWKTYHNSIRLVLIRGSECVGDECDGRLLDLVFGSLVLLTGLDTLNTPSSIERLKRDVRACYGVIDELLSAAMNTHEHTHFSHLTGCVECVIPSEQHTLQAELDKFAEGADSTYGCVTLRGRVVCGTRNFWSLSHTELVLLPLLAASNSYTAARDLPIYLPNKSPNVPFRLLVVRLTGQVSVLVLCGPTPTLSEMMRAASTFWAPSYQVLEALTSLGPRNLAPNILSQLDNAVMGLILVNYNNKKCVSCVHPSEEIRSPRGLSVARKMSALQSVYRALIGPLLQPPAMPPDDYPTLALHPDHLPRECYISTETYKVYIIQSSPYHLLVLFPPALPIHIARQVSQRTLTIFTKGKTPKL